ncbi:MAG: hypothetical protein LBI80_02405 [Endomicrobium sp.]|jgi:hypothetical protein|nr:hypothetical protein [Endomicrobium sp.]
MFTKKVLLSLLMFFAFCGVARAEVLEVLEGFYVGGIVGMAGSDNLKNVGDELKKESSDDINVSIDLSQPKTFYGLEMWVMSLH